MRISRIEEYGLRCALQLARVHFFKDSHLAAAEIAKLEGISVRYVSKIMYLFRKSRLVTAVRGTNGGFSLSREPSLVMLKEVMDAIRAKQAVCADEFCSQFTGLLPGCLHISECSMRPVWLILTSYFDEVLSSVTLHELLARESEVRRSMEVVSRSKANSVKASLVKNTRTNMQEGQP